MGKALTERLIANQDSLNTFVQGRVSVIIPTYNYRQFVLDAIESALSQSVSDLEIIVVDDGSTDDTSNVIGPYKNRIKYIYQKNAGLSEARNTGIANSTGEFMQFLDADDILGKDSIHYQLKCFKHNPDVHMAICRNKLFEKIGPDGKPVPFDSWNLFKGNLDLHLYYLNIAPPHAFLFRREAILETGWFDPQLKACEDYDFWLRALMKGFIPCYNPSGLVYYRRHSKSMSANLFNQYLHDAILHKRLSKLIDEYPDYPQGRRLEGILAFSSGAILTASRLYSQQPEDFRKLMELALLRIEDAKKIAASKANHLGWNMFTKLFYLRIVNSLALPCFRSLNSVSAFHDNLKNILFSLQAPNSKTGIMTDVLVSTLGVSSQLIWERWELRRLVYGFFKISFWGSNESQS